MDISIIMPVYNAAPYLEKCIGSVAKQTVERKELICIDDGSIDESWKILQGLEKKYPWLRIYRQDNRGPGPARNVGVSKAVGRYIAFLDADDWYLDADALDFMIAEADRYQVKACAGMSQLYEEGELKKFPAFRKYLAENGESNVISFRDYQEDYHYTRYIFKREMIVENNIDFPNLRRYQDPPFLLKALLAADKVCFCNKEFYCVRLGHQNFSIIGERIMEILSGMKEEFKVGQKYRLDILQKKIIGRINNDFFPYIKDNMSLSILNVLQEIDERKIVDDNIVFFTEAEESFNHKNTSGFYYLFPYEKIKPGSKVVIYGAGVVGQWFLQQIRGNGYAELVAVIDKNWMAYAAKGKEVSSPSRLKKLQYDCVLISIENVEIAREVFEVLVSKYDINKNKIIFGCDGRTAVPVIAYAKREDKTYAYENKANISLAFLLPGGLGDDIIAKKFIESLCCYTDGNIKIDLFCPEGRENYCEAVFEKDKYSWYPSLEEFRREHSNYDASFVMEYTMWVESFNFVTVKDKCPMLAYVFHKFYVLTRKYNLHYEHGAENYIHFARCRYLGHNCYTSLGRGIIKIDDYHVKLPMSKDGKKRAETYGLKRYITLNYGWGSNKKTVPNKVWPFANYERLLVMLKKRLKDIEIVQMGGADTPKIDGADAYVFDEKLDTVKYVLKDSLLHIDCEGGLVHLATQLGTKCLVLFGPTPVHYFGYADNINIFEGSCHGCYYLYDDYSVCAQGREEAECMRLIKPERVFKEVMSYIEREGAVEDEGDK